eukprot:31687-Amphidinium_carterae.1
MEHKKKWNQQQCPNAAAELCPEYFVLLWTSVASISGLIQQQRPSLWKTVLANRSSRRLRYKS